MNLYMHNKKIKKKFVFVGDTNSINIEIILRSHAIIKNKIMYVIICNKSDFEKYLKRINFKIKINEIFDPIKFTNYEKDSLNIFNIHNISKEKYKNLLNQINFSNKFSTLTGYDLVTMPVDKSIFKAKIKFTGITEYLGKINKTKTAMLMHGENFSVIPLTTHINVKEVHKQLGKSNLKNQIQNILDLIKNKKYRLEFKDIKFLCYNPHCGENSTIGNEDDLIKKLIQHYFKEISGPYPADSAFNKRQKATLYISTYHDQALIPFKILNKKGINFTLGLNYRRFSPAHGTAKDIKFKNKSNNISYVQCMLN